MFICIISVGREAVLLVKSLSLFEVAVSSTGKLIADLLGLIFMLFTAGFGDSKYCGVAAANVVDAHGL